MSITGKNLYPQWHGMIYIWDIRKDKVPVTAIDNHAASVTSVSLFDLLASLTPIFDILRALFPDENPKRKVAFNLQIFLEIKILETELASF